MRCPDCAKFTGLEFGDPEVVDEQLDSDGDIHVEVRIVRTCSECSQELKEATLSFDVHVSEDVVKKHKKLFDDDDVELEVEAEQYEESGGRYAKSYFGATISWWVRTRDGEELESGTATEKVAASGMEEMT